MKIIYNENPLRTTVELDEHDRQVFWLKLKIEELQNSLFSVHFNLMEGEYFDIERARKKAEPGFYFKEDHQEKTPLDERVDNLFKDYVEELLGIHSGDCTCVPCSCMKCGAEEILGINTLGINTLKLFPGKHQLSQIDAAFSYRENGDIKHRSLNEALTYLRDHKISREKPESWKRITQTEYESYIPRWEQVQSEAYEYLKKYAKEHFVIE